jgi:hypothetical protein
VAAKRMKLVPPMPSTLMSLAAKTNRMTPRRSRVCAGALFVKKEKADKPRETLRSETSLLNRGDSLERESCVPGQLHFMIPHERLVTTHS